MPWRDDPIISPAQQLQNFLAPAPNTQYGDVVPLARGSDGSLHFALPNVVRESLQSWARLMNVPFGGDVQPRDLVTAGSGGLAGSAGLLGKSVLKHAVNVGENAASRNLSIYNPPRKPPRSFEADYPNGAVVDAEGRLTHDIEGRPLTAPYIAGRRVAGGRDEAISDFNTLGTALTGQEHTVRPAREMGQDAGRLLLNKYTRAPQQIQLRSNIAPAQRVLVLGHEVGHAIDETAGQIDTKGLNRELRSIYNTLNNGHRTPDRTDAPLWSKPATPQGFGSKSAEVPREHMAEAIRAYMADPNYLKTVAA